MQGLFWDGMSLVEKRVSKETRTPAWKHQDPHLHKWWGILAGARSSTRNLSQLCPPPCLLTLAVCIQSLTLNGCGFAVARKPLNIVDLQHLGSSFASSTLMFGLGSFCGLRWRGLVTGRGQEALALYVQRVQRRQAMQPRQPKDRDSQWRRESAVRPSGDISSIF